MNIRLVLAVFPLVVIACSPAPDYSSTVKEFQRLKNDGNVDLALNMFTDNSSLQFGALGTISGLGKIRGILEYDAALNTQLRFERCETAALEVTCRVTETNDWLRLVDIESITYVENKFTFTADGRIRLVEATLSAESGELLGAAMAQFDVWARSTRPTEYAELFSKEGAFVYSRENAEKVLALLRQWRI